MTTTRARSGLPDRMMVDEYLAWAEENPGRYELDDGHVVAMSPERVGHGRLKYCVQKALEVGIARAGLRCEVLPDGMTVRVSDTTAYEPDALVHCGGALDPNSVEVTDPTIVVEVISPGSRSIDTGRKAVGYLTVSSIAHYLVIEPYKRAVIHYRRVPADQFATSIVYAGEVTLDPPGFMIALADIFAEP